MFASRAAIRATRGVRVNTPAVRQSVRRYAESSSTGSAASSGGSSVVGGAAAGAAASLLVFALAYQFTGIGQAAKSMSQAKGYVDSATEQLKIQFKENTPEAGEAIEVLKQGAYKYAAFIPGGREYVDKAFKDIEIIRKKHSDEVDSIVKDAYEELKGVSKNGLTLETASQTWSILSKYLQKLSSLAVDAGQDILDNHPELKKQLGGSFDQLKQFGDQLGPEAKKQVDETYKQMQEIINEGFSWNTVDKIRKVAQEKVEELKKLRNKAWEQGYEQVQPMLKDNPEVKKFVEENADALKNGNVAEALEKVKEAVTSGDMGSLNEYIKGAKDKADQFTSGSISKWLAVIPGGSQILPQLQKLRHIAESKGPEAEKLAKETMADIKEILDKRSSQVEDLYKNAEKEAKK